MADKGWSHWKDDGTRMTVAIATALVTGRVVANWVERRVHAPATTTCLPSHTPGVCGRAPVRVQRCLRRTS